MLETALGFFIALIVIISFAGLVFLYPLTFRVSVSTGHLALHTAVPDDEEAAEEAEKEAKRESEVFEYVEAVQIRAVNAKDLRLRAEAMARIHSERSPPQSPPPPPPIHTTSSPGASRRACPPQPHPGAARPSNTTEQTEPPSPSHGPYRPSPHLCPVRRPAELLRGLRAWAAAHAHGDLAGQQLAGVRRDLLGDGRPRLRGEPAALDAGLPPQPASEQ